MGSYRQVRMDYAKLEQQLRNARNSAARAGVVELEELLDAARITLGQLGVSLFLAGREDEADTRQDDAEPPVMGKRS